MAQQGEVDLATYINGERDSSGNGPGGYLSVNTEGTKATYSASVFGIAPAASSTDMLTILGSATKTVRVTRLWVVLRATAATAQRVKLVKYSTAYSSGTAVAATIVPHDSSNAAASAVVNTWAGGLPTVGTPVGSLYDHMALWNIVALTTTQPFVAVPSVPGLDFGIRPSQAIVLRGTTQYLALNFNTASPPSGGVFDATVEWTEE